MKFVGLVGSNYDQSYNRKLLEFIRRQFKIKFELEVLEIDEVPMFNQDEKWDESFQLRLLYNKITRADGVIIATPEHNHTISASLKSVLEWLSFEVHPFENKPVMIVGASYYDQGTSRAQVHLRKILDAPGVNAYTRSPRRAPCNYVRSPRLLSPVQVRSRGLQNEHNTTASHW